MSGAPTVVLVAGAGRSGTSSAAGALKLLGLHLPQPEVEADETNPRGFFEPRWVVDLHRELLNRDPVVRTLDARPEALDLARSLVTDDDRARVRAWLGVQLAEADGSPVVIKDPRLIWFYETWREAADAAGVRVAVLTMLRHPVEVAKSRDTHYTPDQRGERFRRQRATANVAGWCAAQLVTERLTRGEARAFVAYPDLLADWRGALTPVVGALGLDLAVPEAGRPHPVDDFLDAGLRRSETTWEFVDVPEPLRVVAEGTWDAVSALRDDPADAAASARLDALALDYERLHDHAVAIALDHTRARETQVRRKVRERLEAEPEQPVSRVPRVLRWAGRTRGTP